MAKHVIDYFTKEDINDKKDIVSFIVNGTKYNTCIDIDRLCDYSKENSYKCTFGAETDISFQYTLVVKMLDTKKKYSKECHKKDDKQVLSVIECNETAATKLYSLCAMGYLVSNKGNGIFTIVTPYFKKLTSFRRVLDFSIVPFFDIQYINAGRFKNKVLVESIEINKKDFIKECQKSDRQFNYKWISNRIDKTWN